VSRFDKIWTNDKKTNDMTPSDPAEDRTVEGVSIGANGWK